MGWIEGYSYFLIEKDYDGSKLYKSGGSVFFKESDVVEVSSITDVLISYTNSYNETSIEHSPDMYHIKLEDGTEYVCKDFDPLFEGEKD